MGLFLRQDEQRSEVQQRVATELEDRLRARAKDEPEHESTMLEGQHTTRRSGMVIIVLMALLVIAIVALALSF
ncbi:MAG TPA: hypothetical protein VF597_01250 [Candidatus Saccharimonadales bacterium]|jgi:hypothetical protein